VAMGEGRLPPRWHRVLELVLRGLPLWRVAEETGYTYGTVRHIVRDPRLQRALHRLLDEALEDIRRELVYGPRGGPSQEFTNRDRA